MTQTANLKRARMRAGLNGAELARALEMEPGTWRRIERGERQLPFDLARQIAEVLDCAVDDLITGENVGSEVGSSLKVSLPSLRSVVDLPIFGVGDLSSNKVKLVRTGSFIARPGNVSENDAAYAMHVFDDAAAPRYDIGDMVIVDPTRPVQARQWAVFGIQQNDDVIAQIWRLDQFQNENRSKRPQVLVSRNGKSAVFDQADLVSIDLIVGSQLA